MRNYLNFFYFRAKYGARVYTDSIALNCQLDTGVVVRENCFLRDVKVGQECYINRGAEIYQADIARFCSIGQLAQLGPNEHLIDEISTCNQLYNFKLSNRLSAYNSPRTVVESDVWIGARAVVVRGIKLGVGAVVGAGSIVTKDVEPYTIVAGVPAKVIKKRFSKRDIGKLLESEWWCEDANAVRAAISDSASFHDEEKVDRFVFALNECRKSDAE